MGQTVRRGNDGEITHKEVDGQFYKKEDANKIMWDSIKRKELTSYVVLAPGDTTYQRVLENMLLELLNGKRTVNQMKARILRKLGKVGRPE